VDFGHTKISDAIFSGQSLLFRAVATGLASLVLAGLLFTVSEA